MDQLPENLIRNAPENGDLGPSPGKNGDSELGKPHFFSGGWVGGGVSCQEAY